MMKVHLCNHWSCFINWLQILKAATWWLWSCCCYWRTSRWSPSFFPPFLCKLLCSYEHQEKLLNICSHSMKSCTFWKMNKSRWSSWQSMEIRRNIVTLWTTETQIKGSMFNLQIRRTNGSIYSELLGQMIKYDPVSCTIYGKEHILIYLQVWTESIILPWMKRWIHQSKLAAFKADPKFKFGKQIRQNYQED